jgi:hypothetical protein
MRPDVELPRWAVSAHEFVAMHRRALEGEHVSRNINRWIDYIFGVRQRDREQCFFFPDELYEEYTLRCPPEMLNNVKEKVIVGVCPSQIFAQEHPARGLVEKDVEKRQPITINGPVVAIGCGFLLTQTAELIQIEDMAGSKSPITAEFQRGKFGRNCFVALSRNGNSVHLWPLSGKGGERGIVHRSPIVSDMAVSGGFLAIGGSDGVVSLWGLPSAKYVRSFVKHSAPIVAVAGSFVLDVVVSIDESGEVFMVSMLSGKVMHHFRIDDTSVRGARAVVTENALIAVCAPGSADIDSSLSLYDFRGKIVFRITLRGAVSTMEAVRTDDYSDFIVMISSAGKTVYSIECSSFQLAQENNPEVTVHFLTKGPGRSILAVKQRAKHHFIDYIYL